MEWRRFVTYLWNDPRNISCRRFQPHKSHPMSGSCAYR